MNLPMKLKSFGCSFVFGTDLAGAKEWSQTKDGASNHTWPARIAQHLGYDYECFAWAGLGNLQILERVLNQVNTEPALFVVNWSWIDRFDYYDSSWNPGQKRTPWNTIMPIDEDNLAKIYYRDLHSEYRDKLTTLIMIKLAIDTLQQHGHQIIMSYMDDLIFETEWHVSPAVLELQDYVRPFMTTFEGKTFLQWCQHHGYRINELMHPLEEAHAAAADYLINQG